MNKPNIAELLKNCPTGMELDCNMYDNVSFVKVTNMGDYPIVIKTKNGFSTKLTEYGQNVKIDDAKCVIFPKGKTTWEGFQRPFKDGDILAYQFPSFPNPSIYIHKYSQELNTAFYVALSGNGDFKVRTKYSEALYGNDSSARFATEEEKQKLFQAIKDNGYRWNAETKTLEKLIEPKFKVGDKIEKCSYRFTITEVKEDYYLTKCGNKIPIENQDDFNLIPDKFDISNLKEFDKVLVRGNDGQKWIIDFFGFMDKDKGFPFCMCGHYISQCIPYEPNKHLFNTTDDCDDFYKTW